MHICSYPLNAVKLGHGNGGFCRVHRKALQAVWNQAYENVFPEPEPVPKKEPNREREMLRRRVLRARAKVAA